MKLLDQGLFNRLTEQAKSSQRLRANTNLHSDYQAKVQRLFIAMEPNSYVRPHKHVQDNKWEFFFLVKGAMLFFIFDENGVLLEKHKLEAGGDKCGLEIPPNTWHSTLALESDTIFFEVKEGPYIVMDDKGFADWAPAEGDDEVDLFLAILAQAEPGNKLSQWRD